jgi:hypothetical protein
VKLNILFGRVCKISMRHFQQIFNGMHDIYLGQGFESQIDSMCHIVNPHYKGSMLTLNLLCHPYLFTLKGGHTICPKAEELLSYFFRLKTTTNSHSTYDDRCQVICISSITFKLLQRLKEEYGPNFA